MREFRSTAAIVPTIVLHEVKFQFENLGEEVAELRLDTIIRSGFSLVDLDAVTSARLRCRYEGLPTADAIVAATSGHQDGVDVRPRVERASERRLERESEIPC